MLVRNENKSAMILRIKNRHRYFLRTCIHAFTHARKHTHEINKGLYVAWYHCYAEGRRRI